MITNAGIVSILRALAENRAPGWQYMAVGYGTSQPTRTQEALDAEFERIEIAGGWTTSMGTSRVLAVFGAYVGNWYWREFGIFDSPAKRAILSTCESTTGWTSDGTLTTTTFARRGQYAIQAQMLAGGTLGFANSSLQPILPEIDCEWSGEDRLQFYFRSSTSIGSIGVQVGNSSENYYHFVWSSSAGVWQFFDRQLIEADAITGMPIMPFTYFRLLIQPQSTQCTLYLDDISVFGPYGNMLVRGLLTPQGEKTHGVVWNLYCTIVWEGD